VTAENHRRLGAIVAKLDAASRLAKEATVDIAASGLFPVEVREEVQKIAAEIDAFVRRRLTSVIREIP
jgi:hypothetical protein